MGLFSGIYRDISKREKLLFILHSLNRECFCESNASENRKADVIIPLS